MTPLRHYHSAIAITIARRPRFWILQGNDVYLMNMEVSGIVSCLNNRQ